MPIQRLAPSFGYCTFSWNVTYPTDLSNDTGVRASTAVYVSGREVRCQVPLDLPPATHAVQLFFTQGRYTLEARYGANVTSLDLIVFPAFAIYDPMPRWAPCGGQWQVSLPGSRILPLEEQYNCSFGTAPPQQALRISLKEDPFGFKLQVAICARGEAELQKVAQQLLGLFWGRFAAGFPGQCHAIVADLSSEQGVKDLMSKLPWKELDILVNNCGTNIRKKAEEFEKEEFAKVFDTNFMSCMWLLTWLSLSALPLLRASDKSQGRTAAVVNISSVAGYTHIPSGFPYAASKAAMNQMTKNLSVEWARFGIRVNAVGPGAIETPLMETASKTYLADFKDRKPLGRLGQVGEVARPVAFLASEAASFITGQTLYVDGGFTATSFNRAPGYWEA
ncbi:unnamed protein product [Effrenium voratum]|nr:unnamed protein product [Effrenium voratum]